MDQKLMTNQLSYNPLILDAIGFRKNTKNFELKLATEATPTGIDLEESYL
jgi:hypothetical protein